MAKKKVVLITGVAGYWGSQLATRLVAVADSESDPLVHFIGLDREPPEREIKGLDFIQADVRNPLLVELLKSEQVHTVCHLVFSERVRHTEAVFDINVMGTMKLLGACAEAGVKKIVLKSSMAVYGAHPDNPAFITEEHPLQGSRAYGYTRHLVEIEAFCSDFRRQAPEMILTIFRFSNIVGPNADTPMTRFLKQPKAPVLLGFDPLMQVVHEQDVVGALMHAVLNDVPGVFNIAAEGILPLSRLTALTAKVPIPLFHPFVYWGLGLMNSAGLKIGEFAPIELDYLRYPWVGDLTKMHEELGFVPVYSAEEALREFAGEQHADRYTPESATLTYDEERLRDTIERRRRAREQNIIQESDHGEGESNE